MKKKSKPVQRMDDIYAGAHIRKRSTVFGLNIWHEGIVSRVGNTEENTTVVHFIKGETQEFSIVETSLTSFRAGSDKLELLIPRPGAFTPEQVVKRARSRLAAKNYRPSRRNCEHFAEWCVYGNAVSFQVVNIAQNIMLFSVSAFFLAATVLISQGGTFAK